MALLNMLREPRREITETLVGLGVVAVPIWLDYRFGMWMHENVSNGSNDPCPAIVGMLLGAVLAVIALAALAFIHFLGDLACDFLENRGLQMRPKQRR